MMRWFAAHLVMMVEMKGRAQDQFPVWENVILVQAVSEEEAFRRAESLGRDDEGDEDGTFRWGDRPATWVFVGVRKLTECGLAGDRPDDGDEISFTEFQFATRRAVEQFVGGRATRAVVNDRYRESDQGGGHGQSAIGGDDRRRPA